MSETRKPIVITEANFAEMVLKADKPVVLYFWHETCGPCKTMSPKIDTIAQQFGDRVSVCKSNVHDWNGGAEHYKLFGVPQILMICKGETKHQVVGGGAPLEQIKLHVEKMIADCTTGPAATTDKAVKAKEEFDASVAAASDELNKQGLEAWTTCLQEPCKGEYEALAAAQKPIIDEVVLRMTETTAKKDKGEVTQDDWFKAWIETMRKVEEEPAYKDAVVRSREASEKLQAAVTPHKEKYEQALAKAEAECNEKIVQAKAKYAAALSS